MKKFFTVLLSFCAMIFAMQANAQATVTLTAGDVWGDGSGYQMLLDADHTAYGTTIPTSGALTTSGDATAAVYNEFEYKIPTNADGSCTTQNIVINNSVTISIPAGTYDWCITNPTPGDRIWIASSNGNVGGRADDYVFENGKTYTFTVTRGGNNDQVDVVVTLNPTGPAIDASPNTFNFGNVAIGQSKTKTSNVMGFFLTSDITATTTAASFKISSDGTTFGSTATLDSTGGTLYFRYTPTVAGADTGIVTLSCDTVTNTITLIGTAVDCSQAVSQLPWTEDFSGTVFPPLCWDVIAATDTTWDVYESTSGNWASCSGTMQPRVEQLITNKFDFTNYTHTILLDFEYRCNYSYVSDGTIDLKLYASTDGGVTFGTTPLWSLSQESAFETWAATPTTVNLSSLAGQSNVVLKFAAEGSLCQVLFSNLNMYAYNDPTIVATEDEFSFYAEVNTNEDVTANVNAYNLTGALTATTTAPFAVSGDGQTFGTTATLTGNTLYIRYTPTVAGQHTGTVTLASAGATNVTLSLSGEAYDCSTITLPYIETFDHNGNLPPCVTMVYANGDPTVNPMRIGLWDENSGDYVFGFNSYSQASDYTQYLITPELPDNTGLTVSFDWLSYSQSSAETMNIGYSSTDNNVGSFTWLGDEDYLTTTGDFETAVISLPAGARYVAFKYVSNYQYYLWLNNLTITGTIVGVDNHENVTNIYPNPADNVLNINANSNISLVEVFNVMGQMVASYNANDVNTQINTSNFANGVYTVKIHTENGVSNQKFTVAR